MTELDPALKVVGRASDYDGSIAAIKARLAEVKISYSRLDELANLPDGWSGKVLGDAQVRDMNWRHFLAMIETLGIGCMFYVDPKLVEQMQPHWDECQVLQRRTNRLAKIGKKTLQRVFPVVLREHASRAGKGNLKLSAEFRSERARLAGKASGRARLRKGIAEAARARVKKRRNRA